MEERKTRKSFPWSMRAEAKSTGELSTKIITVDGILKYQIILFMNYYLWI